MSEEHPPASRGLTLEHVARAAGVSRATVSRVINNTRNVDPEIQEIVQRAIEATGYVPSRAARTLVTRRSGSIALIVSATNDHTFDDPFLGHVFNDPFFGRVVSGAISVLRSHGVHLVLMVAENADSRAQLVQDLRQGQVDGAIIVSMQAGDPLPAILMEAQRPVVLLGRPSESVPISYVDVANHTGTILAADHLVRRGCARIATVAGPADTPAGQDRLTGFRAAMARHGHPFIPAVAGNFTLSSGERAMEQLLAQYPDLDGVFVANDLMAQGALLVLRDHGRRVPEDVAVVGFDDSSAATASRPALTTIRQPVEDMAARMAELLLARIDQPDRKPESVIFEPTLVLRQSA
jgi:DNA-binding LacI/PurR family transcriptional regulator